jgi:MFS family permease
VDSIWWVIVGATVIGIGTGIGYAAMPTLISVHTPAGGLAAANGLNSLARSLGTSLASAVGGSILASSAIDLGNGSRVPSLSAYQELFAACAGASVLAAVAATRIPRISELSPMI